MPLMTVLFQLVPFICRTALGWQLEKDRCVISLVKQPDHVFKLSLVTVLIGTISFARLKVITTVISLCHFEPFSYGGNTDKGYPN